MNHFLSLDNQVSRRLQIPLTHQTRPVVAGLAHLGDGGLVYGLLSLGALLGLLLQQPMLTGQCVLLILLTLPAATLVVMLKHLFRRPRPGPADTFVHLSKDQYSFPSGHAARMGVLGMGVGVFSPLLVWPGLMLTLVVGLARVAVGVHYLSDVLAGWGIGLMLGWLGLYWLANSAF